MTPLRRLLLTLAVFLWLTTPVHALAGPVKLEWKLEARQFYMFTYSRNVEAGAKSALQSQGKDQKAQLGFFGADWDDNSDNLLTNSLLHTTDVEKLLLLQLFEFPGKAMRVGQKWNFTHENTVLWDLQAKKTKYKGDLSVVSESGEDGARTLELSGSIQTDAMALGMQTRSASLTWTGKYSESEGILTSLEFEFICDKVADATGVQAMLGQLKMVLPFETPEYFTSERIRVTGSGTGRVEHPHQPVPQNSVDQAIAGAAHFLMDKLTTDEFLTPPAGNSPLTQMSDMFKPGILTLGLFAIIKSGEVEVDDPRFLKGVDYLLNHHNWGPGKPGDMVFISEDYDTYTPGLILMLGEAVRKKSAALPAERHTQAMIDRETRLRAKMEETLNRLLQSLDARTAKKTPGWGVPDLSNTQYGILGLHAAARDGIFTSEHKRFEQVWRLMVETLLKLQIKGRGKKVEVENFFKPAEDGESVEIVKVDPRGWGYGMDGADRNPTLSMTCTGIASLAIAMGYLDQAGRLKAAEKRAIEGSMLMGVGWLVDNMTVWHAGDPKMFDMRYRYYMYAMERAGVIAGFDKVGQVDWYRDGALSLLAQVGSDGSWNYSPVETAFALLFLKRASAAVTSSSE